MSTLCIDRIEKNWAICQREDGDMVQISLEQLPISAQEGDFLRWETDKYVVDPIAKMLQEQRIANRIHRLHTNNDVDKSNPESHL